jgi:uncharacterized protein (TIGR03067 family)
MTTRRNALLIGLAVLAISLTGAEDNPTIKKDMAQLQGEWTMVSGERDGLPFPDELRKSFKRSAKGDEATVTMGGQLFTKAKFTLDPAKKPKAIDYSVTGGNYTGQRQLGVYELDGDTLKLCFSLPGKERPTDFTTKTGDGRTSTAWKREKKTEPAQK